MQRVTSRLNKELEKLKQQPPPGILCWPTESIFHLEAQLLGPDNTPYENGVYHLDVYIPERYPFEPPKLRFVTPVYHPNIDNSGRICLDVLKMPPNVQNDTVAAETMMELKHNQDGGSWKPSLQLSSVLTSIQLLLSDPNPDDPLMTDIAEEYKHNRVLFLQHAKEWTEKYAMAGCSKKSPVASEVAPLSVSHDDMDCVDLMPNRKKRKVQ